MSDKITDPMSWEQNLVNAQVSVNRSVFEMNRPGALKTDPEYKDEPDPMYIVREISDAIDQLENARLKLYAVIPTADRDRKHKRPPRRRPGRPRISRQTALFDPPRTPGGRGIDDGPFLPGRARVAGDRTNKRGKPYETNV